MSKRSSKLFAVYPSVLWSSAVMGLAQGLAEHSALGLCVSACLCGREGTRCRSKAHLEEFDRDLTRDSAKPFAFFSSRTANLDIRSWLRLKKSWIAVVEAVEKCQHYSSDFLRVEPCAMVTATSLH